MKYFIRKLALFLFWPSIVSIIICSPALYTVFRSNEYLPVGRIIAMQQANDILVGTAIQSVTAPLKYMTVKKLKPGILALGTSRVMQFRREFFTDDLLFYNAGGIANLPQYIEFVKNTETSPEFLIIGLDQYFFCENYAKHNQNLYHYEYNFGKLFINAFRMLRKKELSVFQKYGHKNNIGLAAMVHGDGFRKDGSYFYNRIINYPDSEYSRKYIYPFTDTTDRIDAGNNRFEYGDEIYSKSINQVIELLSECKVRNINVVAFIPPFAPYINKKLEENGNYGYIKKIYPALIPVFNQYDYELYDFTDSSHLSDNTMYIDGFHGDETVYHNILLNIKENESVMGKYIRPRLLQNQPGFATASAFCFL